MKLSWGYNDLKLRSKLMLAFTFIGSLAIGAIGYIAFTNGKQSLQAESFNKLTAVREMKGGQIEAYFQQIENQIVTFSENRMIIDAMKEFKTAFRQVESDVVLSDAEMRNVDAKVASYYSQEFLPRLNPNLGRQASVQEYLPLEKGTRILQNLYLASNPNPTGSKENLDHAGDSSHYSEVHQKYHPIIRSYLQKFGYYDIFLVEPDTGHIVYTVFKEVDYATSLLTGPYSQTNFARAFKAANRVGNKDFVKLIDFESYHPSYNAAASFIASPIYDGDEKVGVLLFQMPTDRINAIMTNNQKWSDVGLGASGETYIVGADYTLRNQSRFLIEDAENYFKAIENFGLPRKIIDQIKNTQNSIGLQKVQTVGTQAALNGETNEQIFLDYRGVSVLSSYRPLDIKGVQWVLMSEIDEVEAFAPITSLGIKVAVAALIIVGITLMMGFFFSVTITRPLHTMMKRFKEIARGDLTLRINVKSRDEIGDLGNVFNSFVEVLQKSVFQSQSAAESVTKDTDEITNSGMSLAQGAAEQASTIEEISATMQTISAQSDQNAGNAIQANQLVTKVKDNATSGEFHMEEMVGAMSDINETSQDISKIIKTIDEIAFQTNLLALNAAVEAARAGVHGKGFAVVASEVRDLAGRSAKAAHETAEMIEESVNKVRKGMEVARNTSVSINQIIQGISEVSDLVGEISISSKEQSSAISQVTEGVRQIGEVAQENALTSETNTSIAQELSTLAHDLKSSLSQFNVLTSNSGAFDMKSQRTSLIVLDK